MIKTVCPGYELTMAEEKDVPVILSFITKLAQYEKLEHEVVATEELLRENLFGKKSYAEVVIGYYNEKPVSFALFFHNFSTFLGKPGIYLEDLFVLPEVRGKGFGKILITYLAHLAGERGCGRLEWSCLDWNKPSLEFYRSIGAKAMDEWTGHRLTGKALSDLAAQF